MVLLSPKYLALDSTRLLEFFLVLHALGFGTECNSALSENEVITTL